MTKKALLALLLIAAVLSALGCNTIAGLGRDITGASDSVRKAVQK